MASGIFAILDDIAALMDDVSVASKIATQKTAGILGDDLAVNAEKASGFLASREIPVLVAITKGSFLNKLIIIPAVFLLNFILPDAIKYILIIGGFYLAFEGVEKIVEYLFHSKKKTTPEETIEINDPQAEKKKIKSAILTDFILSIEIVIIALSTVLDSPLYIQIIAVAFVALLATVGVYGVVALIVRMDDAGYKLINRSNNRGILAQLGHFLVRMLPVVIKMMGIIGTIALILVAGGIFTHQTHIFDNFLPRIFPMFKESLIGLIAGIVAFFVVSGGKMLLIRKKV
ncbi:MAG: DUF808 family protein [Weeksellaceae bacterium]